VSEFEPYRAARPPGLPADRALPAAGRPRLRSALAWMSVALLTGGCTVLSVAAIASVTGVLGVVTGVALAAVPVFPVVAAFLWLDRYEAEPPSLLAFAFAWGAGVASFGAIVVNTASLEAIREAGGDPTTTVLVVAPLVEEALKGAAVLLIVLLRRREFDGIVDGIVYAGLAGVGFAFVENVLYLGRSFATEGGSGLATVFVIRCVVSPFAHPLFTAATGAALGLAAVTRRPAVRVLAPLGGFALAVGLHAAWNLSALSGLDGFLGVYVLVQVPIFAACVVLALLARRREGVLIARHLALYARTGWLTRAETAMLASLPTRREARGWAARTGGPHAHDAMRDFQELGSELAFLRERMTRGSAPPDAPAQELALLAAMSAQRAAFMPAPRPPVVDVTDPRTPVQAQPPDGDRGRA
jgi:RsiW-degrading membrane proteinase PrsW (M82 family)